MQDIQLYDGLIGALIGGVLSAGGAFIALWWQSKEQRQSQAETARKLMYLLFREQERSLDTIMTKKANHGYFSYWDINVMQANYDVFHRNKEWMVHFKDRKLREEVLDLATDLQIWTAHARDLQQRHDRLTNTTQADVSLDEEDAQYALLNVSERLTVESKIMTGLRERLKAILPRLED